MHGQSLIVETAHVAIETRDLVHDADRVDWALEVAHAIDELPPAQRNVVRLAYFEHLSHARIAERLSLSKGEVSGVLAAALAALTARLGLTAAR